MRLIANPSGIRYDCLKTIISVTEKNNVVVNAPLPFLRRVLAKIYTEKTDSELNIDGK